MTCRKCKPSDSSSMISCGVYFFWLTSVLSADAKALGLQSLKIASIESLK